MRVAVIGAGPAGLAAAYRLGGAGVECEVFEGARSVGGMSPASFELWGQTVDLGPHRFASTDPRVNRLWLEVVGNDYRMVDRCTRILFNERFYHDPLEPGNVLRNLGPLEAARCLASHLVEKARPAAIAGGDHSLESRLVGRFGRRFFETLFKTYNEKLWGIPCGQLDADLAARCIGGARHKSVADRFAYPVGGTGMVYERMVDAIHERGGRVHLGWPVRGLIHEGGRVRGLTLAEGGGARWFDHVISTMPLTQLVRCLGPLPDHVARAAGALTYRTTRLVYLNVGGTDLFPDQWVTIHSPDILAGRVTNFRNWVPELHGNAPTSIVALEYWCDDDDPLWVEPDPVSIARATRELADMGLSAGAPVLDARVVRVHRSHPVHRAGYQCHLARLVAHLRGFAGLTAIGRYGSFKDNDQDQSLRMGILAAENLAVGARHDLWSMNTDGAADQFEADDCGMGLVPVARRPHLDHRTRPAHGGTRAPVAPRSRDE